MAGAIEDCQIRQKAVETGEWQGFIRSFSLQEVTCSFVPILSIPPPVEGFIRDAMHDLSVRNALRTIVNERIDHFKR